MKARFAEVFVARTRDEWVAELGPADVRKSLAPNAPVVLLRVDEDATGKVIGAARHLSWAEPDANADVLVQSGEDNGGLIVMRPSPAPVALLISAHLAKGHADGDGDD